MRSPSLHDEADHVAPLRAERDAHAHLVRSLRDVVRDHAVETDRREHQRQRAEHRKHQRAELPRADLARDDRRHRRHGHVRPAVHERLERPAHLFGLVRRRTTGSNEESAHIRLELVSRHVVVHFRLGDILATHVFGDADHGGAGRRVRVDADAFADRVLVRPELLHHRFARHHHARRVLAFGRVERAASKNPRSHRREEIRRAGLQREAAQSGHRVDAGYVQGKVPTSTGTER